MLCVLLNLYTPVVNENWRAFRNEWVKLQLESSSTFPHPFSTHPHAVTRTHVHTCVHTHTLCHPFWLPWKPPWEPFSNRIFTPWKPHLLEVHTHKKTPQYCFNDTYNFLASLVYKTFWGLAQNSFCGSTMVKWYTVREALDYKLCDVRSVRPTGHKYQMEVQNL